jgi:hypothetical protein
MELSPGYHSYVALPDECLLLVELSYLLFDVSHFVCTEAVTMGRRAFCYMLSQHIDKLQPTLLMTLTEY